MFRSSLHFSPLCCRGRLGQTSVAVFIERIGLVCHVLNHAVYAAVAVVLILVGRVGMKRGLGMVRILLVLVDLIDGSQRILILACVR